jgi:zinc transporter ZupT
MPACRSTYKPLKRPLLQWDCDLPLVLLTYPAFLLAFSVASVLAAAAGVILNGVRDMARRLLPASGLLLMAVSLLLVLPELGHAIGWANAAWAFGGAVVFVWVVDKFLYPVCPSCAHSHDHDDCATRLHGFAPPLMIAMLVHNAFDGWMLSLGQGTADSAHALSLGVIAHKIPECFAFGAIIAASVRTRSRALAAAVLTQAGTLGGAALHRAAAEWLSPAWIAVLLAIGGGVFFYLGFHAVHGEWKRRAAAHPVRLS